MRNYTIVRKNISLESAISLPMLAEKDDTVILSCFFYRVDRGDNLILHAPFARIDVRFTDGELLWFGKSPEEKLFGDLPTDIVLGNYDIGLKGKEIIQREKQVLAHYNELVSRFPESLHVYPQDKHTELSAAFQSVTPATLHPYYKILSPTFFTWIISRVSPDTC